MGEELQVDSAEQKARQHAITGVGLTSREFDVACAIASGLDRHEIATKLKMSTKTVDTHRLHVLAKVRVPNAVSLAHFAIRHGWVDLA